MRDLGVLSGVLLQINYCSEGPDIDLNLTGVRFLNESLQSVGTG